MGVLVTHPWIGLIIAAAFIAIWLWCGRLTAVFTAILWLAYSVYEHLKLMRVLCTGDCNIRVDLLLIYPVLLIASAAALIHSLIKAARHRGAA